MFQLGKHCKYLTLRWSPRWKLTTWQRRSSSGSGSVLTQSPSLQNKLVTTGAWRVGFFFRKSYCKCLVSTAVLKLLDIFKLNRILLYKIDIHVVQHVSKGCINVNGYLSGLEINSKLRIRNHFVSSTLKCRHVRFPHHIFIIVHL